MNESQLRLLYRVWFSKTNIEFADYWECFSMNSFTPLMKTQMKP